MTGAPLAHVGSACLAPPLRGISGMEHRLSRIAVAAEAATFAATNLYYIHRMRREPKKMGHFARILYNFDTIAFPALLAATAAALVANSRQKHGNGSRNLARLCLGGAGVCVAARIYATHIEPRMFKVRHVRLRTSKLQSPLRIVHMSDMETDAVRSHEPRVIARVRELAPDLVVHTGDLLNPIEPATYESELPKMAAVWEPLEPPLGKFTLVGEVDRPILSELRNGVGGLRLLNGDSVLINVPGGRLNLLGLTFHQSFGCGLEQTRSVVENWVRNADPTDFTVLLGHRPDFIQCVDHLPIDLCLAGHTHGGQVRVPFYGPLATQSTVPRELAQGFHRVGRTWLNVTAGVGFEHGGGVPAIRVNCPPEVTLFELEPL